MKTKKKTFTIIAITALILCGTAQATVAADVEARLSTREAFVGMPVVLQISIRNASSYQQPAIPEIDGCEVRSGGAPSQSSQITIINGRRSENRSITMQYLITPRRAGTFVIPAIDVTVDGQVIKTRPSSFVVSKSETGDLLFIEIEGGKNKVYVGQPLDLSLRIWLKPFVDADKNVKLSEANMWDVISKHTSWGSFAEPLQKLAQDNRRPAGHEVLRNDGQGEERSYYLYEINTTVYPTHPGKIDTDDVQVVVNYPTALGKARDPFGSFFKDSPFGRDPFGGSPMSRMMGDEFFASPFRNRLTISSTRPIVGEVQASSTVVRPVPEQGRPADYRGAVGKYRIVTQASPTTVNAGDPITLNIGIAGTGPMELVQAPPLNDQPSLTSDFKVASQSLAGFVQGDSKVFSTTIRPRRKGIAQIPPITFSFFDPDTETFETVLSDPVSITVDKADSMSLDAIVSRNHRNVQGDATAYKDPDKPDFSNSDSASLLLSQSLPNSAQWWWVFIIAPPIAWLVTLMVRNRTSLISRLPSFKSTQKRSFAAIDRARDPMETVTAITHYIASQTGMPCPKANRAFGALRTAGLPHIAIEVESFAQSCEHRNFDGTERRPLAQFQQTARDLVMQMEVAFSSKKKSQVRRSRERQQRAKSNPLIGGRRSAKSRARIPVILLAATIGFSATQAGAFDQSALVEPAPAVANRTDFDLQLNESQKLMILKEASEVYARATKIAQTDVVESKILFTSAAEKYRLLVDSGIQNGQLYLNLGNSLMQNGELGQAIANYERARQLDPSNPQVLANLGFANSWVGEQNSPSDDSITAVGSSLSVVHYVKNVNVVIVNAIGIQTIVWIVVASSILFWGIMIVRASGCRFAAWRFAVVPLAGLVVSLVSIVLAADLQIDSTNGVVTTRQLTLRAGDGEQFEELATLEKVQGHRIQILVERDGWANIKTAQDKEGWVDRKDVENFILSRPAS